MPRRSPYAVAKSAAHWLVSNYRNAYGLFACSGILFNHESILRPKRFVTRKIISTVVQIVQGKSEKLFLGNLSVKRDWGWAPEYIEAMWMMLNEKVPDDYVIATGECNSLENFVAAAFDYFDLDWRKYVEIDRSIFRPSEIMIGVGNPSKANKKLGWVAKSKMNDIVKYMVNSELDLSMERNI